MTSSVVKLHDFTKPDKNPAQGLLGIVTEAQLSIRKHRYHEASDILAMAQHVDKGKAELRIARAFLEIRCQMALSNLEKAHYAWQDLEEIFLRHPQMNNSEAMLLGARLHWAHGDITGALQCSKKARSLSRNSRDLILSQTAFARTDLYLRGSAATALEELMPIWSALKVDCSFSENSKDLSSQLKRTLILAALTQGKLHLAQSLAEKVETLRSVLDLELHVLTGIISIFAGETNLAIRAAQDIDLVQLKDGSSRQEYGSLAWWQSIIYHAAGLEKEAYRKAEDYHELITALGTSTQPSELQPYADALLASCLIQRKGITRASQLTGKYMNDSVLSAPIKAMITLCEALIIYETEGLRKSKSLLRKQKGQVFNQDSIMAVGLMCYAHKNLLTLLCKCFSVEQLPPKLTDLLDSEAFQAKYAFTEKQLQQGESAKLHKRFASCNKQIKFQHEREKPLQIRLFGGLEVNVAGNALDLRGWGNSKTRSLFICMALNAGNELAREELIERLWPKQSIGKIRNSYNVTWCQMRRKILDVLPSKANGEADYIYDSFQNNGGRCILKTQEVYIDIHDFSRLSGKLTDYLHADNKSACLATIKQMIEIYKGDLLPGDRYLEWLEIERKHYSKVFLDAMLLGANICLEDEEPEAALFYLHRIDFLQSDNEELHYLSMKAYAAAGRREDAINTYLECRRYLRDELGLDPSQRITDIYQKLLCAST